MGERKDEIERTRTIGQRREGWLRRKEEGQIVRKYKRGQLGKGEEKKGVGRTKERNIDREGESETTEENKFTNPCFSLRDNT